MSACHNCHHPNRRATWNTSAHMLLCGTCETALTEWQATYPGQPARRWESRHTTWDEIDRKAERRGA